MNPANIAPIVIIILIALIGGYRIIRVLSGSAPRRTKMVTWISMAFGIIVVLILGGLQLFHIIP